MALPPHLAALEQRLASRFAEAMAAYRRAAEAQLRRESDRWLGELAELPAPAAPQWLAEPDLAALDLAPRGEATHDTLARLAGALRTLDVARGQAEALDALLDGARGWADRVALVLARDSGLSGWGDRGFGDAGLAGRELDWDTTLRERLLASRGCLRLDAESAAEVLAQFGVGAAGGAVIVPLVLRDRVAALLWADRAAGEPDLAALQILVHATGQRLELQALSERSYSPTLWEGAEAPGEPLPLWSAIAPAPPPAVEREPTEADADLIEPASAAEIAAETAAEESGSALWQTATEELERDEAPVAEAPVAAFVEESAEIAAMSTYAELAEPASEPGEIAPPEIALVPEPEPMPAFELESVSPADDEAARWEPAAEPATEPPAAVEPETPADLLGTVRMKLPALDSPARPSAETTAPLPVFTAPAEPAPEPAETHEVELPPVVEPTFSEEATQLSMRRPPIPAPIPEPISNTPPPSVASTVAIEPPTWSVAPGPALPPPAEDPLDRTASRFGRSTEVAPPPDVSGPGLAFLAGRAGRATSSDPAHEEAKRLARLLISEIRLYNEEQVLEGRRNRDLYHRLKDDIDRSRQIFDERVDAAVRTENDYFQQELVRSLAGGDPRALGI